MVSSWVSKISPFAVRRPWKPGPYQDTGPCWIHSGTVSGNAGPWPVGAATSRAASAARVTRTGTRGAGRVSGRSSR